MRNGIIHLSLAVFRCRLALVGCALALTVGCAGMNASGRSAGRPGIELRGVLVLPAAHAPAGVVAVLQSRSGTRSPCNLRTADDEVAADIRAFAAKGTVVLVSGAPGEDGFAVTEVRAEGQPRRKGHAGDAAPAENTEGLWPGITWGSVPVREK